LVKRREKTMFAEPKLSYLADAYDGSYYRPAMSAVQPALEYHIADEDGGAIQKYDRDPS